MIAAGVRTDLKHFRDIQKQDPRRLLRGHIDHQPFPRHTGVGFRKDPPLADLVQDTAVSPRIHIFDQNTAREHQPDLGRDIPCAVNGLSFFIIPLDCL